MSESADLPRVMPAKRADVLTADFEAELVVLVPEQRTAHRLDEGLSLILDACDGTTSTDELVTEIAEGTGQDRDAVRQWMRVGLRQLAELGVFPQDAGVHDADGPT